LTGAKTEVPADGNVETGDAGAVEAGGSGKIVLLTLVQPPVTKTSAVAAAPRSDIERRMGVPLDEAER
jgi:hypothetical protein